MPEALVHEVRTRHLPIHIQRGVPFTDENGTVLETVIIDHPDTDFDFDVLMSRVINEHYQLKEL